MPRLRMIAPAREVINSAARFLAGPGIPVLPFTEDAGGEATLVLVEAYRSVDDSLDDDDQQIDLFWASEWGPPVREATFCAREGPSGPIVGLSLVCLLDGLPLVAHLVVAERTRRRGVAATLLASSARGLLDVGIDTIELAVDTKNRNALHLYARLGFRLDAPDCQQRSADGQPQIGYVERASFDGLRSRLLAAMVELEPMSGYVVEVRSRVDDATLPVRTASAGAHLSGSILALVTGWRSGPAAVALSRRELDTAIALLSPTEASPAFGHDAIVAWRKLRDDGPDDQQFAVRFSTTASGDREAEDIR